MDNPEDIVPPSSGMLPHVTRKDLFLSFLGVGLTSFGGVMPFARRMLVEERQWLSEREFIESLSLGQILPGPNVVNLSIMVGARFQGWSGAVLAFLGLMSAPLAIILILAVFYSEFGHLPAVQRVFNGLAAATAGLVVAMGLTMASKLPRTPRVIIVTLLAFLASGVLGLPLVWVLLGLAPISIALAWRAPS